MIADELAQEIAERQELIHQVVARHQGEAPVAIAKGPCESSGYCSCRCKRCLGGRHMCGHRRNCHKACKSL